MAKIGTAEAARRLGISQGRVSVLIREGRLKAERIGRMWIIDERDLKAVEHRPTGRPPVPNPVRPRPR